MITHKFREVTAFADDVSVLRRGKLAGSGKVGRSRRDDMAAMMIGDAHDRHVSTRDGAADRAPVLEVHALSRRTAPA